MSPKFLTTPDFYNLVQQDIPLVDDYLLFSNRDRLISIETLWAIMEDDEGYPTEEEIEIRKRRNLKPTLDISTIQQIIENARMQTSDIPLDQFIEAVNYYLTHDAFIHF